MTLLSTLRHDSLIKETRQAVVAESGDLLDRIERFVASTLPVYAVVNLIGGMITGSPFIELAWRGTLVIISLIAQRWFSEAQNSRTLGKFSKEATRRIEDLTELQKNLRAQIAEIKENANRTQEQNEKLQKLTERQGLISNVLETRTKALAKTQNDLGTTAEKLKAIKGEVTALRKVRGDLEGVSQEIKLLLKQRSS